MRLVLLIRARERNDDHPWYTAGLCLQMLFRLFCTLTTGFAGEGRASLQLDSRWLQAKFAHGLNIIRVFMSERRARGEYVPRRVSEKRGTPEVSEELAQVSVRSISK